MKTAGKKITYTKKPTKISKFEIFILNPVHVSQKVSLSISYLSNSLA
jgi:hypothetical protein